MKVDIRIAGSGPMLGRLQQLTIDLGVSDIVSFPGPVDRDEVSVDPMCDDQ